MKMLEDVLGEAYDGGFRCCICKREADFEAFNDSPDFIGSREEDGCFKSATYHNYWVWHYEREHPLEYDIIMRGRNGKRKET